jgi:hypothetical protein
LNPLALTVRPLSPTYGGIVNILARLGLSGDDLRGPAPGLGR